MHDGHCSLKCSIEVILTLGLDCRTIFIGIKEKDALNQGLIDMADCFTASSVLWFFIASKLFRQNVSRGTDIATPDPSRRSAEAAFS